MKVIHRIRIGQHEVHYAGDLVDGARCLQLFGDVATELLIRHDGDEGLFRAYQSVEFLAPVRSGDVLEIEAELLTVGRTSRTLRFEARKVIELVRDPLAPPSRARVLPSPVLVCKAVGTCVVPPPLEPVHHDSRDMPR